MPGKEEIAGLTLQNFLPRGATMQQTGEIGVLALVIYTGKDTKIVLNQGKYKYKTSNSEYDMNWIFLGQMIQIIFFCTIFAILQS